MSVTTLSGVPASIRAGDTVRFTISGGNYPAPTWVRSFVLQGEGVSISADAVAGVVTLSAEQTAALRAGSYTYATRAKNASTGESVTVETGRIPVLPNLAQPAVKSFARETLEKCEAALKRIAGSTNASVSVNGQSYSKRNLDELSKFRDRLRAEVNAEELLQDRLAGHSRATGIGVRFRR